MLDGPPEVALTETNRSWPRRVLEGCAIFALGLFGFAKIFILFLAALWLIAKVFGFADFAWWIHHLGVGFMGVAIGLYLIFCWFLPDQLGGLGKGPSGARRTLRCSYSSDGAAGALEQRLPNCIGLR